MRQSYIYQDFRFQRGSFVFPKDGLRPAVFCNFWSRLRLVADACNELGRSEAQFPGCLGYESDLFLGGLYPDPNHEPPPETSASVLSPDSKCRGTLGWRRRLARHLNG